MSSPDEQRQALSAFTDSQTDDLESRRTAAALLNDPDLQNTWRRFHLIGALLRNEVVQADSLRNTGSREATLRLRAALAQEVPLAVEAATPAASPAATRLSLPTPRPVQKKPGRAALDGVETSDSWTDETIPRLR